MPAAAFSMASEMASMEDIEVRTALARGDVASAPPAEAACRRGLAREYVTSMEIAGASLTAGQQLDSI